MRRWYRSGRQAEASDLYQRTPVSGSWTSWVWSRAPDSAASAEADSPADSGSCRRRPSLPKTATLPSGTVTFRSPTSRGRRARCRDRNPVAMRLAIGAQLYSVLLCKRSRRMQVESGREGTASPQPLLGPAMRLRAGSQIAARSSPAQACRKALTSHPRRKSTAEKQSSRSGHYYGPAVYRCARLLATGHGDQVLLTQGDARPGHRRNARGSWASRARSHRLRNLERPEVVFQVIARGFDRSFRRSGPWTRGDITCRSSPPASSVAVASWPRSESGSQRTEC